MTEPLPALPDLPSLPAMGAVNRRAPAAGARREWVRATVAGVRHETARARTLALRLPPGSPAHVPGQHYTVRLTAPDGYQATRSYSAASAPGDGTELELTVERLADGEVSGFLTDGVGVGDALEIRGPFGGWFVWQGGTPAILIGGGSGVVPVMSMLRHRRARHLAVAVRMLVAARSPAELLYARELQEPGWEDVVSIAYSRQAAPGSWRPAGRITTADVRPLVMPDAVAYVCGSTGFAEHASQLLVEVGVPADRVRVERFGPS